MHSIEILELEKTIYIPENLNECDRNQRLDISKLVLMYQMAEINLSQFKILALYNLMNMEYSDAELPNVQEEKWQNLYVISELLNSFFEIREDGKMQLIFDSIENPVKKISYKAHSFFAPSDWFKSMKWGQFIDAIGELQNFTVTGKIECLVRLFAIMHLKHRESYTKIDLDKREKFFDFLDIRYVYHFYLLFNNFWIFLTKQSLIRVDGKEIDLRILFEKGDSDSDIEISIDHPDLGFRSTAFQLAESGVFGTMAELNETDFGSVILRMYDMLVRLKLREAEMEALKDKK